MSKSENNSMNKRRANLTPEQKHLLAKRLQGKLKIEKKNSIKTRDTDLPIPLSYAQRSLWLTWQLDPKSNAYNMSGVLTIRGELNKLALKNSLQALISRHEVFRTLFITDESGEAYQHIKHEVNVPFTQHDLTHEPDVEDKIYKLIDCFVKTPFALDDEIPFRAMLVSLANNEYKLVLSVHHIAADGWSLSIVLNELIAFYTSEVSNTPIQLTELPIQFADFAIWQKQRLEAGEIDKQLGYWRNKLHEHTVLELPFDRPRNLSSDMPNGILPFNLSAELSVKIKKLAQQHQASLYMVVLSLFKLTLFRFSGQTDLSVGSPIANRTQSETHGLVGYLTNIQVLRTQVDFTGNFIDLLSKVRKTVLEGQANQDIPFDLLVEMLKPERQAGIHPFFQVKCTEQQSLPETYHFAGLEMELEVQATEQAHFDLSFDFTNKVSGIEGVFSYNAALFNEVTIQQFLAVFTSLTEKVVEEFSQPLALLTTSFASQKTGSVVQLKETSFLDLWNESVEKTPSNVAIKDHQSCLSYLELEQRSSQLAAKLQENNIKCGDCVAIVAERSCEFVLAILAVLKSGAMYLPLDPKQPEQRLQYQLKNSHAKAVLALKTLPWVSADITQLHLNIKTPLNHKQSFIVNTVHTSQPAYMIYTSGTTGQPKGVVVSHGALNNYIQGVLLALALPNETQNMAMASTVAADLGHTVLFGALATGKTLHLLNADCAFDPDGFSDYMVSEKIDVLKVVPSHLQGLLSATKPIDVLPKKMLILGGEASSKSLLKQINQLSPLLDVVNHYGPTEGTVGVLTNKLISEGQISDKLGLGLPIANTSVYVLGTDLQPVPTGVEGELYIGGAGIAQGYLGKVAQTAERFIADPNVSGARLYRTGDKVKQNIQGTLEFIGRVDEQVNIRGYRVELNEITQHLKVLDGIADATVITKNDQERVQLYGCLVAEGDTRLDITSIRETLLAQLPDYMVPTGFIILPNLPLNTNGKLDKKALLTQLNSQGNQQNSQNNQSGAVSTSSKKVSIEGPEEEILADIWQTLLKIEKVDRHDNFFELGGDSILALQVVARARKKGLKFTPKALMDKQTISALSSTIKTPTGYIEKVLTNIWQELLNVEKVDRHDNFFELGGDSILALQVVARARKQGLKFTPKALMGKQTISALSLVTTQTNKNASIAKTKTTNLSFFPLLPTQHWFFEQNFSEPEHWNQSIMLQAPDACDVNKIKQSIELLLQRHPTLSMCFEHIDGQWLQQYASNRDATAVFETIDLQSAEDKNAAIETTANNIQSSLSFKQPFKAAWLATEKNVSYLLLVAHHLVIDAVSWRIILDDLQSIYENLVQGKETSVDQQTAFKDWSEKIREKAQSGEFSQQLDYWHDVVGIEQHSLPGNTHGDNTIASSQTLSLKLSNKKTCELLSVVPKAYKTQINDILLAALTPTLCQWASCNDVLVELEGHGRETLLNKSSFNEILPNDIDLSSSVGWFTSLYPVRLSNNSDTANLIKGVKETLNKIPDNGLGYGILKYLTTEGKVLSQKPYPQITFNYLGQFDQTINGNGSWVYSSKNKGIERALSSQRRSWLEFNLMILDGKLQIELTYSKKIHTEAQIKPLLDEYLVQLEALIIHCTNGAMGITPSDFPLAKLDQVAMDQLVLPLDNLANLYPLSPMQSGMYFHTAYEQNNNSYINQLQIDITNLDSTRFKAAWQAVLQRHDILRTGFINNHGEPLQWVANQLELPITEYDWRDNLDLKNQLKKLAQEILAQGFSLDTPPLMKIALVRVADDTWHFIWTRHHLLLDGWSTSLLLSEVLQHYSNQTLTPMSGHYQDYIHWLIEQDADVAKTFWLEQLQHLEAPTYLLNNVSSNKKGTGFGKVNLTLNADQISSFVKNNRITANTLIQGTWSLLLSRYCQQSSIVFGSTVAGRPSDIDNIEQQIGLFINTLPVIVNISASTLIDDWLRTIQQQNLSVREYEHTPLNDIQRWAGCGSEGLFDSIIVFENYPVDDMLRSGGPDGLTFGELNYVEETNYPLTLTVIAGHELTIEFSYDKSLYDDSSVTQFSEHFQFALAALMNNKDQPLGELNLLTDREQYQLHHWGVKPFTPSSLTPVHLLFEQQANKTPEAMALTFEQEVLNYNTLNKRVNQLAHTLIAEGVQPEDKVGIAVERSVDMVVSLLAVLKAGGAFVPLDPTYPKERLAYMIEDSGLHVLLTQHHLLSGLPANNVVTLHCLDTLDISKQSTHNPVVNLLPDNLAYLIYTSGSTGRPKAVAVSHAGFSTHAHVTCDFSNLVPNDRMLQFSTINFDGFIEQLFPPLTLGAGLVLRGKDIWDAETFYQQLIRYQISVIDLPTAYWFMLVQHFAEHNIKEYGCLREVHLGGEAMPPEGVNAWRAANLSHVVLLNAYGPTEAVVTASVSDCQPYVDGQTLPANMPIGRPLGGRHLYVVDSDLNLTPQGVAGELCIGGDLLARGYLGRQDLTASSFIADPFSDTGARLYRTGDLVRWRADGELEYLGRIDHQVKIRGFRIELGEIEAAFLKEAAVTEAIVIAKSSEQGARLIAYVAGNDLANREMSIDGLKASLSKSLPDHMVPSAIVILEALPLNPSGKIDRHALPAPDLIDENRYEAPIGEVEKQIAAVWSSVLGLENIGLEKVGRHDNFFTLGGDSILTLKVVAKASKQALNLTPKMLFEYQTIALLSQVLNAQQETDITTIPVISKREGNEQERAKASLSFAQSRQWFLWQLSPESTAYHISGALTLTGEVNINAFTDCFTRLIARHEALRTIFKETTDGAAQQVIQAPYVLDISVVDLRATQGEKQAQAVKAQALAWHGTPFDLTEGPLLRVGLIQRSANEHVLVVVMHHIISDDWSMQILIDEFIDRYQAMLTDNTLSLPVLSVQYADYAVWQQAWLAEGELEKQLAYWCDYLGDEQPVLQLPTDHARKVDADYLSASYDIILPEVLSQQLKHYVGAQQSTLFTVFLSAYQVLLSRYTGQADIRVGVPIANRHHRGTDNIMGFFVNTQVLRGVIDQGMTLSNVLANSKTSAFNAQVHQDLPFEKLVEALQPERSLSHTPLFQVMYNHLRNDKDALARLDCFSMEEYVLGEQGAQFELTLDTNEDEVGQLSICFSYAKELFNADTIARLSDYYIEILQAFVDTPKQPIGELNLLTDREQQQLHHWGVKPFTADSSTPVHILFEQQANKTPEAMALTFEQEVLNYNTLNKRVNQLAHTLIAKGVQPEDKVGIAVERSVDMVVSLLAVLKAGGAFVPLDPTYPKERLAYMIEDSGLRVLLTQHHLLSGLPANNVVTLHCLDTVETVDSLQSSEQFVDNPRVSLSPDNLAYLIYTSGSTGRPKAVAVSHAGFSAHVHVTCDFFSLVPNDRMLQFSTINFDGFIEQLFPPLTLGAGLVLRGKDIWDAETFYQQLICHQISVIDLPTAYWFMLVQHFAEHNIKEYGCLREVHLGGEAMPPEGVNAWRAANLSHVTLLNTYGPTEAVVTASVSDCQPYVDGQALPANMPIGRPLGGRHLYVVDSDFNLTPQGVAGELCIGGDLLARGYLGRQDLTASSFIADPFSDTGARLYRTGDLVRWRADGELEYLGRIDHQVKIRGFRIELGEIEAAFLKEAAVTEAIVIAKSSEQGARLIAYVAGNDLANREMSIDGLKASLSKSLPDHMVPSAIVILEALPLNPSGKIDRHALPEPDLIDKNRYESPIGEVEEQIAAVWSSVLGLEKVGRHDNFFTLGGDSILSLQIVVRLRQLGLKITPKQLFEHQMISTLANVVISDVNPMIEAKVSGNVPLLPIQHEFFELDMPKRHYWNQSVLLHSDIALDLNVLEQALIGLIKHHDSLRLRYAKNSAKSSAGQWQQYYEPLSDLMFNDLLLTEKANDESAITRLCNKVQSSLDISHGPVIKALAIELPDNTWRLLVVIHHLMVDGVSWRILLNDLQVAYQQLIEQDSISLSIKTNSYLDWSKALSDYCQLNETEFDHWQQCMNVPHALPADTTINHQAFGEEQEVTLTLSQSDTTALLTQAPIAYRTQVNDLLLTALGRSLCQWCDTDSILIDLEGHGREDLFDHIDISNTVGWFTSLYPIALSPQGDISEAIKSVKEMLRGVPNKGIGYGLFKYRGSDTQKKILNELPKRQVVFNYLGQFDSNFDDGSVFNVASESSGHNVDKAAPQEHVLSINGQIYDGQLSLNVIYNTTQYSETVISAWIKTFKNELKTVITHCSQGDQGITPSDFPLAALDQTALNNLALNISNLDDLYPLSPMQSGMLFHSLYDLDGNAYVTQLSIDVTGLDVDRFREAWQAVLQRHDILRTGFITQDETQLQWVAKEVDLPFQVVDWSLHTNVAQALENLAHDDLAQGFDFNTPPLMRLTLVKISNDKYHFIWTCHHILLDGWSTSLLLGEVLRHYTEQELPSKVGRYRDYIAWLVKQNGDEAELFWREQLSVLSAPTRLTTSIQVEDLQEGYDSVTLTFKQDETADLFKHAKAMRVTMNTLVQGAWSILLSRYCGQDTVTFGSTVAGRPSAIAEIEQQIGLFINTLPVIVEVNPALSIVEWLTVLQQQNLEAREYEHTPLSDIQRWAECGTEGLFDNILVFENYPVDEALRSGASEGLIFGDIKDVEETNYPLTLGVFLSDVLTIKFNYDKAYYDESTIIQFSTRFKAILKSFINNANKMLGELEFVNESEHQQLNNWGVNSTTENTLPVHIKFEQQAKLQPDATAVVFAGSHLTYAQLSQQANQLAHYLQSSGISIESKIGIALPRSLDTVVALLAVLKAGALFIPLDMDYPAERLAYIIEDSGIDLIISHSQSVDKLPALAPTLAIQVCCIDQIDVSTQSRQTPALVIHPKQLAYVIYTSGSTGRPKGAAISHDALSNCMAWMQRQYQPTRDDAVLHKAAFGFDVSCWELFFPLSEGIKLVIAEPGDQREPARLIKLMQQEQVTITNFPPAMQQAFLEQADIEQGQGLRQIMCGGEAVPAELKQQTYELLPNVTMNNLYGPTETTIHVTHWPCANDNRTLLPIGQPISDTKTYVFDSALNPVPQGVAGELYIGGLALGRGYLARPELTADRFIADPLADDGSRLYRTGDLVRWNHEGLLEYLGRIDDQVQIRGFRIELGEIEAQLHRLENIQEAMVIAHNSALGDRLVAYVTGSNIDVDVLGSQLGEILPDYMIPSAFIVLDSMPLSPNGKVDRKALPAPEFSRSRVYEAPEGEVEIKVAEIWSDILNVEQVGRQDNFFELGGHSLLAVSLINKVNKAFNLSLSVKVIFEQSLFINFSLQISSLMQTGITNDKLDGLDALMASLEDL